MKKVFANIVVSVVASIMAPLTAGWLYYIAGDYVSDIFWEYDALAVAIQISLLAVVLRGIFAVWTWARKRIANSVESYCESKMIQKDEI